MLEELFNKLSASRLPSQDDFHAGKMFLLLQDPFGMWCSYHAPREEAVDEPNLYENMRGRTDRSNRDDWIKDHCKNIVLITGPIEGERFKNTLAAMAQGADGIIGATLWDLRGPIGLWGSVNLLLKIDSGKSVFGNYYYKIVQLKRAGDVKEHYAMQTAVMNTILTQVQGVEAPTALFVLRNREQNLDCSRVKEPARCHIEAWQAIKEGRFIPDAKKPPKAALAPWRVYANKHVFEHKDLILLPHLNAEMRGVFKGAGINTYEDIIAAGLPKIKQLLAEPLGSDTLAVETYSYAVAYKEHKPVIRQEGAFPPPTKKRNLYFDFEATETFTKNIISFVYLIGIWDKEEEKFISFVAKNEAEEEKIFKQFADYLAAAGDAVLYHWTEYEVKKMIALQNKYPAIKEDLQRLISACVDLKIVIERAFYLPAPSLSLKAAAPAFGFKWRQSDVGAMDSMVYFTKWLAGGGDDLLNKVLMYNEDDCKAMLFIEDYLKTHEAIKL